VDNIGDNLSSRQSIAKVELQGSDPVRNGGVFFDSYLVSA
jgi:hypothetical protein